MNKKDRGNLAFILETACEGEQVLDDFLEGLDEDNLEYALELLQRYKSNQQNLVDQLLN